jgi:hypothetical protein
MTNRWVIAIAGTVLMVTIGCLYSWVLFTQPLLVAYDWDLRTTTWAYAIANFSVAAVGAVIGGFWQDRAGPRKWFPDRRVWRAAWLPPASDWARFSTICWFRDSPASTPRQCMQARSSRRKRLQPHPVLNSL